MVQSCSVLHPSNGFTFHRCYIVVHGSLHLCATSATWVHSSTLIHLHNDLLFVSATSDSQAHSLKVLHPIRGFNHMHCYIKRDDSFSFCYITGSDLLTSFATLSIGSFAWSDTSALWIQSQVLLHHQLVHSI